MSRKKTFTSRRATSALSRMRSERPEPTVFNGTKVLSSTSTPTSISPAGISLCKLAAFSHMAPLKLTIDAGYIKPFWTGLGISSGDLLVSSRTVIWTSVSSASFRIHLLSQNASNGGGLEVLATWQEGGD